MSTLADKLKKRPPKVETVTIDEFKFIVTGLSRADRSAFTARFRKKDGSLDGDKFDMNLLSERVVLEDGSTLTPEEWGGTDSHIAGPLQSVVLSVCGFDKDDIQRDPKDSDSTKT